ncbi:phosphatidylinositol 3 and 4-kinase-domain-containing protein [Radiomyces spectabilis]|uniref:phosphatidylinositol 3 and 4-kinase-domain-containing protein n=1 Tax=Radiomyces spectabilis TaxID=64574 RepID=UPI00221E3833|nr:phosphatidylinositol 3 and 4-kinase-domain-containing protein [Radiomyces spectabilis]KAI8381001.1 phosphatidylinositol 3 and 4-kinase-domain-containing protein [Radiomyces spectabilis]
MFSRSHHPSTSSGQGAYSRLQQDDIDDEDYDQLVEAISHHPNSILVAGHHVLPTLPQPFPNLPSSESTSEPPPIVPRSSFSSKRPNIPDATKRFLKSKLPNVVFRKSLGPTASFDSLPSVILADIQNGHMPTQADPLLKEIDSRGWTIVHRRRYRGRRKADKHTTRQKNVYSPIPSLLVADDEFHPSDKVTCSVFVKWVPEERRDPSAMTLKDMTESTRAYDDPIPVSKQRFAEIVQSVRSAIDDDIQPTRISQGSSGSYFCRNREGKIVGVFKPKNEEPYGRLNPKWTKWIHRNLFPCFFGRSCLIPNLGYLSESAASLIDRRLGTMIVPHTDVVHLASPSFHYDYMDRRSSHLGLPPKIGSFQCFLDKYKDATVFLREHPFLPESAHSSLNLGRANSVWSGCLGRNDDTDPATDVDEDEEELIMEGSQHKPPMVRDTAARNKRRSASMDSPPKFRWTSRLQDQFKREFEQLVILDYLIRNTDRGLDNWMIKYCEGERGTLPYWVNNHSTPSLNGKPSKTRRAHIHVAAIDNGLAFPFKHPDQWRSYPYGWLALPEALIARPFSEATRHQFLTILSDPIWWRETIQELRELFMVDSDFDEKMFSRQMSVLKGQGYNIVRTLKDPTSTPLDLVAAERVVVNQEEILIEYDERILNERDPSKQTEETEDNGDEDITESLTAKSADPQSDTSPTKPPGPPRSTSYNTALKTNERLPRRPRWKERVRHRLSLDLGRRSKSVRDWRLGSQSDGDTDNDSDASSAHSEDEEDRLKQVTIVMETIEAVKSRTYFTCC